MTPQDNSHNQNADTNEQASGRSSLSSIATATALALSMFSFEASGAQREVEKDGRQSVATEPAQNLDEYQLPAIQRDSFSESQLVVPAEQAEVQQGAVSEVDQTGAVQAEAQQVAPEGIVRIETSAKATEWMQRQSEIATNSIARDRGPMLIDGTTFLTPETERALRGYVGAADRNSGTIFKAVDENGYKFAFEKSDGEMWYVSEAPHYKDQFPRGIPFRETSLEVWKKGSDKLVQKEFPTVEVFRIGRSGRGQAVNFDRLHQYMNRAEEIRQSESQDEAGVRGVRLSHDPTGYIGLVDSNASDPIMACLIDDTRYFAQMMNSLKGPEGEHLYNLISLEGSEFIEVKDSPYEMLRTNIKAMQEKGISQFYLNFAGHGNQHGIFFSTDSGYQVLTPHQLHAVFSEFSECDFVVDTVACYGGGMADKMKSYQDPTGKEGRVFMKLQAKPYSYNQEGRLEGQTDENGVATPYSSYYQIFNAHFLMKGLGLGEAHYRADLAAKQLIPCDAEGWRSSGEGGRSTLRTDSLD